MKRAGLFLLGVLAVVAICAGASPVLAQSAAARTAPGRQLEHVPPTREEMAGIGCITAGTAAAMAAGAVGVLAIAVSGGAAAAYTNFALPVLGTAFAAGCGVGVLAAPGAAWLVDHYVHLIGPRPE
jgi:hypothetical protein